MESDIADLRFSEHSDVQPLPGTSPFKFPEIPHITISERSTDLSTLSHRSSAEVSSSHGPNTSNPVSTDDFLLPFPKMFRKLILKDFKVDSSSTDHLFTHLDRSHHSLGEYASEDEIHIDSEALSSFFLDARKIGLKADSANLSYALHRYISGKDTEFDDSQHDDYRRPMSNYVWVSINSTFSRDTGLTPLFCLGRSILKTLGATQYKWVRHYASVALEGTSMSFEDYSAALEGSFIVTAWSPKPDYFATIFSTSNSKITPLQVLKLMRKQRRIAGLSTPSVVRLVAHGTGLRYMRGSDEMGPTFNMEDEEPLPTPVKAPDAQFGKLLRLRLRGFKLATGESESSSTIRLRRYERLCVVFADIVKFSSWCVENNEQTMIDTLHRFYRLSYLLADGQARLAKSLGDGVLLVSGDTNAPSTMVKLAIDLQRSLRAIDFPLFVRIGVATGPAVSGVLGSPALGTDYWGTAVNLASRLEGLCPPGRVLLCETTRHSVPRLGDDATDVRRRKQEVRGFGELDLWELDPKDPPSTF
eukprot:gnl/Dysnectes_brevis/3043_a3769_1032.p1 GENE.gnl/Dysnectes_brevis/3043_a3769_1032~~gnl/Dysnectes_brevis/3043_a3769_1032.p1  ORF type:complete len:530 (+),score=146.37 gnl/Dysnectes_brevis/3043_a3769_1032:88-1677(+)